MLAQEHAQLGGVLSSVDEAADEQVGKGSVTATGRAFGLLLGERREGHSSLGPHMGDPAEGFIPCVCAANPTCRVRRRARR